MEIRLNLTDGHLIAGVKINDNQFLGRLKAPQLFQIAPDPRDTENRKKVEASKDLQDLQEIREEVQRLFAGQKAKNVELLRRLYSASSRRGGRRDHATDHPLLGGEAAGRSR